MIIIIITIIVLIRISIAITVTQHESTIMCMIKSFWVLWNYLTTQWSFLSSLPGGGQVVPAVPNCPLIDALQRQQQQPPFAGVSPPLSAIVAGAPAPAPAHFSAAAGRQTNRRTA